MTTRFRHSIERGFEKLAWVLVHYRWLAVVFILLVTGGLVSQIPKVQMDTSTESFLHPEDPSLLTYNKFRDQFGRDELVAIAIEAPDVFNRAFLEKLRDLHYELRDNVPHLDDINSLINARSTRGAEGELIVEDLLKEWPGDAAGFEHVRKIAMANPLYQDTSLNGDGTITVLTIKTDTYSSVGVEADPMAGFEDAGTGQVDAGGADAMAGFDDAAAGFGDTAAPAAPAEPRPYLTDAENSAVAAKVLEIVKTYDAPDFKIHAAGTPIVADALKKAMMTNMRIFTLLGIGVIAISLGMMFRRVSGVILPFLVVIPALLSTIGLLGLTGVKFTIPMQILPSFLLAVGVGASVHVLAIFFNALERGHNKDSAIIYTMGHSGLAIVMTSLTTAAGLASFSGAEVAPIADLGKFASVGVMLSLLNTIILLPALLAILPLKGKTGARADRLRERMDGLMVWVADVSVMKPWHVIGVSVVLLLISVAGMTQLQFSHQPFKWLPTSNPSRAAMDYIDERMKGASTLEVVVDTGKENGLYEPAVMEGLQKLGKDIGAVTYGEYPVGKTLSVADILKETNKALNENRETFYTVPDERLLIAQELLLFENSGSDDLEDFVDSQFSKARFTVKMPWVDAVKVPAIMDDVQARFTEALPAGQDVTITGIMELLSRTMWATIQSMRDSYLIAAVVITAMMILLIGNVKIGLLAMIPNLTPIMVALGLMGWLGWKLDIFTMLIGSIAIGLAVDDTIHFMHNYRRYHHDTGSVREGVRLTLKSTGRAMFTTSVVLSAGFLIYAMSVMSNLIIFGLMTGLTILVALAADFFLAPALMSALHKAHLIDDDSDY